jgi:acetate kinase
MLDRPVGELRLVNCHLGAGASVAAVDGGRSVDTTMGFTPLDGLVMATRSGAVDPGLVLWLVRHGIDPAELEQMLDNRSGLAGLAGSGDMRELLERDDHEARVAIGVYVHRLCGSIAAMSAALGGIDALVFTGGVGENADPIRLMVAERLAYLGIEIESADQIDTDTEVSRAGARVRTLVIKAREELQVAAETRAALA